MKAYIYGSGAQGRVINDILLAQKKYTEIKFIDDDENKWGKMINDIKIVGGIDYLIKQDLKKIRLIIAFGDPEKRLKLAAKLEKYNTVFLNAIYPSAVVMKSVKLGYGNMIGANVVINTDTHVGNHTIINTSSTIEHDCQLENGVSVSSGVIVSGRVTVKKGAFICTGAIILPRVIIGKFSVIAAGSVVTKDVPDRVLIMGIPGKIVEKLGKNYNWQKVL
jgi:sugar O-acyltransferase (sialic acid O-acetyltransferase NeuD family)